MRDHVMHVEHRSSAVWCNAYVHHKHHCITNKVNIKLMLNYPFIIS